jgi:DNA (cytosine-5)-methyltransferase 1
MKRRFKRRPQNLSFEFDRELIVDSFAGGGGTSTGIRWATGRGPDVAINHDPAAIAMHAVNHPETKHYCESVWDVDPREATRGAPVGLFWLSPDCCHFSKAKGGRPVEKRIRGLAWIALKWAGNVKPRVIILENVEEFKTWGPLTIEGKPDPKQKGRTFRAFTNALRRQGYDVDFRELRACDYGAPTIRKRFFLIARCDGRPIVWPKPTHGNPDSLEVKSGKLKPWQTAAEIIDWSIPCPSIFDRKKPLAKNTMKRIAKGIQKFVIDSPNPFIIKVNHQDEGFRGQAIDEPLQTVTAKNGWGVVAPVIVGAGGPEYMGKPTSIDKPLRTVVIENHRALVAAFIKRDFGNSVGHSADDPLGTVTAGGCGKSQLVAAFLAKHYGGGYNGPGAGLDSPAPTVTTVDHNALVTSHLIKFRGTNIGSPVTDPVHTITAGGLHIGEVRAFLLKYYGADVGLDVNDPLHTIITKDRFGLVTVQGQDYQIIDIGMRMLKPRELFRAQGFPDDYIIDFDNNGKKYPQDQQVARCGNAVPPVFAEALIRANLPEVCTDHKNKNYTEVQNELSKSESA